MADFHFRFETLLKLRRQQRDRAGAAVGKASQAIERVDVQTAQILAERSELHARANRSRIGEVSVDHMLSEGRYDLQLQSELQSLRQTRDELVKELQRRRTALTQSEIEVKRFERLEELDRDAHRAAQLRSEQAELDDRSMSRFINPRHQWN